MREYITRLAFSICLAVVMSSAVVSVPERQGPQLGGSSVCYVNRSGEKAFRLRLPGKYVWGDAVSEGLIAVSTRAGDNDHNLFGFADTRGKIVVKPQYADVKPFSEGLAPVQVGDFWKGKWGAIDKSGKMVIAPTYSEVGPFRGGLARVTMAESREAAEGNRRDWVKPKYGFIDKTGKIVASPRYDDASDFSEGLAAVAVIDVKATAADRYHRQVFRWGYIDRTGREAIPPRFFEAGSFSEGLAAVRIGNPGPGQPWLHGYVDKAGHMVLQPRYVSADQFSEGLAAVSVGKDSIHTKSGYIDRNGKFVVRPRFEYGAGRFSEGLAAVQGYARRYGTFVGTTEHAKAWTGWYRNVEWGYIDRKGKWVIKPNYFEARPFHEGMAAVSVCSSGKCWGIINRKGVQVVRTRHQAAGDFSQGLAAVVDW